MATMERQAEVMVKSFSQDGESAEHFIAVYPHERGDFLAERKALEDAYAATLRALDLPAESAIFRRVYLSDVLNQAEALAESELAGRAAENPVAVSRVEQPPLPGAKIALLAYHATDPKGMTKRRLGPHHLLVEKNGLRHLWSTGLCAGADKGAASAEVQTRSVFAELVTALQENGASLREHCVRTWVYVKDIDVFYSGMVESRRALFAEHGLTKETHFIASTGIEGACAHRFDVVALDAYAQLDLRPGQVSYLEAPERLCPTHHYGVTFERGTSVAYRDRAHHFISGTASIDRYGQVVHRGNVLAQLDRALGNVEALLHAGAARLEDLMHLVVYLRDRADFPAIRAHLAQAFPELPVLILKAPVCRPEWLVEVEGVAISRQNRPDLPRF